MLVDNGKITGHVNNKLDHDYLWDDLDNITERTDNNKLPLYIEKC